jgi:hypothetical protein
MRGARENIFKENYVHNNNAELEAVRRRNEKPKNSLRGSFAQ